jgi:two-component system, cell cycle response regulator CtrA
MKERVMRALVVEDDPVSAKLIDAALKSEGIISEPAETGEDAIDLAKHYDFDIVVLDIRLPDMEGFEVVRRLRAAKIRTPVLILSGMNETDDKVRGLATGADDYLTKPFHKSELIARIHAIVRRSKGHSESVIKTGKLVVNLDTRSVDVDGRRLHVTEGVQHSRAALLAQRYDAHEGDVPRSPVRRYRRARAQDHRRVHLQAAQEDRGGDRRPALHRDRVGPRLRAEGPRGAGRAEAGPQRAARAGQSEPSGGRLNIAPRRCAAPAAARDRWWRPTGSEADGRAAEVRRMAAPAHRECERAT